MENWHPITVRANQSKSVRMWASLEGKSRAMSEDLYRSLISQRRQHRHAILDLRFSAHVVTVALEAWRLFRSG